MFLWQHVEDEASVRQKLPNDLNATMCVKVCYITSHAGSSQWLWNTNAAHAVNGHLLWSKIIKSPQEEINLTSLSFILSAAAWPEPTTPQSVSASCYGLYTSNISFDYVCWSRNNTRLVRGKGILTKKHCKYCVMNSSKGAGSLLTVFSEQWKQHLMLFLLNS